MSGQPLVISDSPPTAGNTGQRGLYYPPARQDLEGVQVMGAPDDFQREFERGLGLGDELAA